MKANRRKSATSPWPRKSEGTTRRRPDIAPEPVARQPKARRLRSTRPPRMPAMPLGPDSRTVAEKEVPMPGALNRLATPTDSETLRESAQFVPSDPSIAQHHVEVAIINLGPKAEDGTDWLDLFPSERDQVSSISTSDLLASPQPSTRSARDTRQARPPGSFVFVPIPPAVLWVSPRRAARLNERSIDTIVTPAERLMRHGRPPIRAAVHNVSKATRVGKEATRLELELLAKAIRLRLTSGSQVSRRVHRVATASAIAMALATTFI